jgi:hypothetical protein
MLMNNNSRKDEMKDVFAGEFSKKLQEYAKKIKKTNTPPIPNEPVGHISKPKLVN